MGKKCKEHVAIHIRGVEPNTKKPVLVRFYGRIPPGAEVLCTDCKEPLVVLPAAQWAAVTGLVEEWESNVPEGNDKGVLGGMYAGCARQLRKALGLERVTKGER